MKKNDTYLYIKELRDILRLARKSYGDCPLLHKECEGAPSKDGKYIEMCRCGRGNLYNDALEQIARCRKRKPKHIKLNGPAEI